MFIPYQSTPNPDAVKFLPPARLSLGPPAPFEAGDVPMAPLAQVLLALDGVLRTMVGEDFVTVTRRADGPGWGVLRPRIVASLADHLADRPAPWSPDADADAALADDTVEREIRQVIGLYVRPGAQSDGGDILIDRFDAATGTLFIRMEGACNGCPSSQLTLKAGVEQLVRRFVPEVLRVEHLSPTPTTRHEPAWRRWLTAKGASQAGAAKRPIFLHNGRSTA
jgi:Fe-S cluster biogenesis protein NfuA